MKQMQFRTLRILSAIVAGVVCLGLTGGSIAGQSGNGNGQSGDGGQSASAVTRVEEDWEMEVISASDDLTAPQIVMEMSPDQSAGGDYFTLEINHSTLPEYSHGGLQVHAWVNDESYEFQNSPTERTLERVRERIRWTQALEVQDGSVKFSVPAFNSTSIGSFQHDPMLAVTMPYQATELSSYNPQHSLDKSSVPYAKNRVATMTLKRVRYYSGSTKLREDVLNYNVLAN